MSIGAVSVKVNGNQDYSVKSINYGVKKISQLQDVYSFSPIDGDVLVFNAITGKYVAKRIDSSQIDINNIDGGLF